MALARTRKQKIYHRIWMKADRAKNRDRYLKNEKKARKLARQRLGISGWQRRSLKYNLWHQYRMPLEIFDQLVEAQHGACAICQNGPRVGERLHVDHDHRTGKVRGLLCRICNQGMIALDRIESWTEKATTYAMQHQEIRR